MRLNVTSTWKTCLKNKTYTPLITSARIHPSSCIVPTFYIPLFEDVEDSHGVPGSGVWHGVFYGVWLSLWYCDILVCSVVSVLVFAVCVVVWTAVFD